MLPPHREVRGRFIVNAKGEVVQAGGLEVPEGVAAPPGAPAGISADPAPVMGPTRVGEWLMVDVRVAKSVLPGTRLFKICQDLGERGYCGIIGDTFTVVIDLLEARREDRHFLLNRANWPAPK
jgi:hypothetical protein